MKPTEEKIQSNTSDLPVYLFKQGNNWHLGSGISIVLMIFIFVSMMIGEMKGSGEEASLW